MKNYKTWQKLILAVAPLAIAVLMCFFAKFYLSHFSLPECITYKYFRISCPGCGMTRSVEALLDFDILLSLRQNALIIVGLLALVFVYVQFILYLFGKRTISYRAGTTIVYVLLILTAVYSIARNLIPAIAPI